MPTITVELADRSDYTVALVVEDDGTTAEASVRTADSDGAGALVDLTTADLLELEQACRHARDRILTRERQAANREEAEAQAVAEGRA